MWRRPAIMQVTTLLSPTLPTTTGPVYHERQAGTERSGIMVDVCLHVLLLMSSSSECPLLSLSAAELAVLTSLRALPCLLLLAAGLRLAYNDLSRDPTLRRDASLPRVLEL